MPLSPRERRVSRLQCAGLALLATLASSCGGSTATTRLGSAAPAEASCLHCHASSGGSCGEAGYCRGTEAQCQAIGCVVTRTAPQLCHEVERYCEPPQATP